MKSKNLNLNDINNYNYDKTVIIHQNEKLPNNISDYLLWHGDVEAFLNNLPKKEIFDLVVTSPPYNIGKPYEKPLELVDYGMWQERIIKKVVKRLKPTGSICWQVGNYVSSNRNTDDIFYPLDYLFHPIFDKLGLKLRNRIIWQFGHGLHCKKRFSGRYEVILWYTKSNDYIFNLDSVRVPSKYPGKKYFKGPNIGKYSGNPLGKNPEDVWDIPNVKSNHVEKTTHPCQFPVGLIERLVLSMTNTDGIVFDPFAGVGSAGVAAAIYNRKFWGCETNLDYINIAEQRINDGITGKAIFRPHDMPIYDHTQSKLSIRPKEFDINDH